MPDAYISEYEHLAQDSQGRVLPAGKAPPLAVHKIAIGPGSVQTPELKGNCWFIRLHAGGALHHKIGADPTASGADELMPAGGTEFFGVRQNTSETVKVAIIQGT